jgi:hypothetical protein
MIAAIRYWATIATMNVETIIYVTPKVISAMKPRAGTDEDTPVKPFRAVVSIGSTGVGSEVIVPIRASRFGTEIDVDLSACFGSHRHDADCGDSGSENAIESVHESSSRPLGSR